MADLVHLLRHGEVENPGHLVYGSLPGFALSALGQQQAEAAARMLSLRTIKGIWSSPLQRALETAEPLARRLSLPIRIDPGLIEWGLSGLWEGIGWEDLVDRRPGELEAYQQTPADLTFSPESLAQLADRVAAAIHRINQRYPSGEVVVVSHQDPIQAGRLQLTGADLSAFHDDKPVVGGIISLRPGDRWTSVSIDSLTATPKP